MEKKEKKKLAAAAADAIVIRGLLFFPRDSMSSVQSSSSTAKRDQKCCLSLDKNHKTQLNSPLRGVGIGGFCMPSTTATTPTPTPTPADAARSRAEEWCIAFLNLASGAQGERERGRACRDRNLLQFKCARRSLSLFLFFF